MAYVTTHNIVYFYSGIGYGLLMGVLYVVFSIFTTRKFDSLFVKGLFDKTLFNYRNFIGNENAIEDYPKDSYQEFIELNEEISSLRTELDNSTLIANSVDFSKFDLDYYDAERKVVYLKSFKKNLENIIFASQNYRNLLMELYYELNEDTRGECARHDGRGDFPFQGA